MFKDKFKINDFVTFIKKAILYKKLKKIVEKAIVEKRNGFAQENYDCLKNNIFRRQK